MWTTRAELSPRDDQGSVNSVNKSHCMTKLLSLRRRLRPRSLSLHHEQIRANKLEGTNMKLRTRRLNAPANLNCKTWNL